jgi:activator of HSP90 ATPase
MKKLQHDQAAAAAEEKVAEEERLASEVRSGGKTIHMEIKFPGVPPSLLYETLLDVNRLRAFTRSEVVLERKIGAKFSLFSGNITGVLDKMVCVGVCSL